MNSETVFFGVECDIFSEFTLEKKSVWIFLQFKIMVNIFLILAFV